jgi:hypothetical protein
MTRSEKILLVAMLTGRRHFGDPLEVRARSRLIRRKFVEPVRNAVAWRRRTLTTYRLTDEGAKAAVSALRQMGSLRHNPRRFVRNQGPRPTDRMEDRYGQPSFVVGP